MIWLIIVLGGLFCVAAAVVIICTIGLINEGFGGKKEPRIIYEEPEWAKLARQEREASARKFWEAIKFTEEILGRNLTENEVWRLMQKGEWHCACCGEKLEKIDNKLVQCPLCGLRFQKDNAKSKIKCIGNTGEVIL